MIPLKQGELLAIIDELRALVAEGDSFEGFLNYLLPEQGDPKGTYARVEARFRYGNKRHGQGFMRMIGVEILGGGEE